MPLFTNPLSDWFFVSGTASPFRSDSTALWRGYVGIWRIIDNRLYLTSLDVTDEDGRSLGAEDLFPGYPLVFAHWYTGELRCPRGKRLRYVHRGYVDSVNQDGAGSRRSSSLGSVSGSAWRFGTRLAAGFFEPNAS